MRAKQGYLIVGAPESRICAKANCETSDNDVQSVGRAYVFTYPNKTPILVMNGSSEFEQLGYSVDLSTQSGRLTFAVSSMSKDTRRDDQASYELNRAGIVQLFELDDSAKKLNWRAMLKSDRPYSGFGSKIKVL